MANNLELGSFTEPGEEFRRNTPGRRKSSERVFGAERLAAYRDNSLALPLTGRAGSTPVSGKLLEQIGDAPSVFFDPRSPKQEPSRQDWESGALASGRDGL